jgi:protein-arginine kinase activator protein McsA
MRTGMKEAIECEDYERAKELRDRIRDTEQRWLDRPTE